VSRALKALPGAGPAFMIQLRSCTTLPFKSQHSRRTKSNRRFLSQIQNAKLQPSLLIKITNSVEDSSEVWYGITFVGAVCCGSDRLEEH